MPTRQGKGEPKLTDKLDAVGIGKVREGEKKATDGGRHSLVHPLDICVIGGNEA